MTEQELKEIEQRAEKATPGPWEYKSEGDDDKGCHWIETKEELKTPLLTYHWDEQKELQQIIYLNGLQNEYEPSDMEFVAAARTDIPALVAEVRRLKRVVAKELTENDELGAEYAYVTALKEENARLQAEKNRLRPCRGCPTVECTCFSELEDELLKKFDVAHKENARLRSALEFYAKRTFLAATTSANQMLVSVWAEEEDYGKRARDALNSLP